MKNFKVTILISVEILEPGDFNDSLMSLYNDENFQNKTLIICVVVRYIACVYMHYLLLTATEHGNYRETDGLYGERRRPVVGEDGQTDVAVGVHVRVDRDIVTHEGHLLDQIYPRILHQTDIYTLIWVYITLLKIASCFGSHTY